MAHVTAIALRSEQEGAAELFSEVKTIFRAKATNFVLDSIDSVTAYSTSAYSAALSLIVVEIDV
jgi:hypothetical protein